MTIMKTSLILALSICAAVLLGCAESGPANAPGTNAPEAQIKTTPASNGPEAPRSTAMSEPTDPNLQIATFGAGCYWCVEAVLEQLDGVKDVVSGFMGGDVPDPSYEEVVSGRTGHAEVVQVSFDPEVISYDQLLGWFWKLHDPTTLNRQGADVGTQYRSAIFFHSEDQRLAAETSKKKVDDAGVFDDPIVTEITEAGPFYVAKGEHQDFYRNNKNYGYCRVVISPKLDKLGLEK